MMMPLNKKKLKASAKMSLMRQNYERTEMQATLTQLLQLKTKKMSWKKKRTCLRQLKLFLRHLTRNLICQKALATVVNRPKGMLRRQQFRQYKCRKEKQEEERPKILSPNYSPQMILMDKDQRLLYRNRRKEIYPKLQSSL